MEGATKSLERDLKIARAGLKKIVRMTPWQFAGQSNNKNFGKRFEQAFEKAQGVAFDTIKRMENNVENENTDD